MAPGESSDILIVVRELWIASEVKREIRWEGEGILQVNIPGRDWKCCKNSVVLIPSRCCLPKAVMQKLAILFFVLNLMLRGCLLIALLAGLVTIKWLKRSSSLPLLRFNVLFPPQVVMPDFLVPLDAGMDFLEVLSAFNWKHVIRVLFI